MANQVSALLIEKISKRKISAIEINLLQIIFTDALKSVGLDRLNRQIEKLQNETKRSQDKSKLLERHNEDWRAASK